MFQKSYMNYILYFFISFIILYIIVRLHYKYKHKFWSTEPVSNHIYLQFREGAIESTINNSIDYSTDVHLRNSRLANQKSAIRNR